MAKLPGRAVAKGEQLAFHGPHECVEACRGDQCGSPALQGLDQPRVVFIFLGAVAELAIATEPERVDSPFLGDRCSVAPSSSEMDDAHALQSLDQPRHVRVQALANEAQRKADAEKERQEKQRKERENGVPLIKHQWWSGAELMDAQMSIATGGNSSTAAMGAGVTEQQFEKASA